MSLEDSHNNRIKMSYEYYKINNGEVVKKVATGMHEVGCFARVDDELRPILIPDILIKVLEEYKRDLS